MMSMSKEDLIIRNRDENDKRSFIYFINEEAAIEAQAEN
jgi:DNA-binding MarR family transcriptional regulator